MTLSPEQENNVLAAALMLLLRKSGDSVTINIAEAEMLPLSTIFLDFDSKPGHILVTRVTSGSKTVN